LLQYLKAQIITDIETDEIKRNIRPHMQDSTEDCITEETNNNVGTMTRDLQMAFKIPHLHDFVIKLCRQQAKVILNHEYVNNRNTGRGEAQHMKYKNLTLSSGHTNNQSSIAVVFSLFPPVPLETLFHSTLYPQSCWCIIQVIHNYI
jgi:hypothetical protein